MRRFSNFFRAQPRSILFCKFRRGMILFLKLKIAIPPENQINVSIFEFFVPRAKLRTFSDKFLENPHENCKKHVSEWSKCSRILFNMVGRGALLSKIVLAMGSKKKQHKVLKKIKKLCLISV